MTPATRPNDAAVPYRIVLGHDEGWDVVCDQPPQAVSSTHCADWHRVERVCAMLDRQAHETASPPLVASGPA